MPHVGGYCKNIHELSRRLVERGHVVDVITCNTEPQVRWHETMDNIQIIRIPLLWHVKGVFPLPLPSPELLIALKKYDYDLIVTHSRIFPTTILGALHSRLHHTPLIHVERGSQHTVVSSSVMNQLSKIYDHTVGRMIVSTANQTVGISKTASAFIQHMRPAARPLTIHNGIELPPEVECMHRNTTTVIFTGRIIYAKGVQDLLKAFHDLAATYPFLKLVIVGDGIYLNNLRDQVSRMTSAISSRIKFTGEVPQKQINSILSTCDIFVNPSYSEGLPTTVMEAASVGLPIIATDVGGTSEVITDGISGLLIRPHDVKKLTSSLEWMLTHRYEAIGMGREARKIAQTFSWEEVINQWEELIVSVEQARTQDRVKRNSAAAG